MAREISTGGFLMGYFRKIVGGQLYLSPVCEGDAQTYVKWMNDEAVAKTFGQYDRIVSSRSDLTWLYEPGEDTQRYAVVLLEGDEMIGCISLQNIDHLHRHAFLGIFLGPEYQGKGYGTQAIRLLLDYGFNTLNLHNIMLSVHADNRAGIACFKKAGFKEAGRRREWVFKDGKYVDVVYMDILAGEFGA